MHNTNINSKLINENYINKINEHNNWIIKDECAINLLYQLRRLPLIKIMLESNMINSN